MTIVSRLSGGDRLVGAARRRRAIACRLAVTADARDVGARWAWPRIKVDERLDTLADVARRSATRPRALLAAIIAATTMLAAVSVSAATGRVRYVTDGDTFRLESGERIRIAGIDAPETHADQARCREEMARGRTASATLRNLIDGRTLRFERVGRSYNRTVARVWINGRDLAATPVASGTARPWPRFAPKPNWCTLPLNGSL